MGNWLFTSTPHISRSKMIVLLKNYQAHDRALKLLRLDNDVSNVYYGKETSASILHENITVKE